MLKRYMTCLLLGFMVFVTGCKSTPVMTPPPGVAAITLSLQTLTTDKRYTYFELTPDGTLSFAGGFDAINRSAHRVMTLTPDQLHQVQALISQSNLFTTKVSGRQDRKSSQKVHYELALQMDQQSRKLTANDDVVPALSQLHALLFEMQAQERYKLPGIGTKNAK